MREGLHKEALRRGTDIFCSMFFFSVNVVIDMLLALMYELYLEMRVWGLPPIKCNQYYANVNKVVLNLFNLN